MKKKILAVICGIIIVIMLLAVALFVWAVYDELTEKPLIRESLLDDKVELDVQGDDIQALLGETEALLQFREAGWRLCGADVRLAENREGTMEYTNIYLYFKQKDGIYKQKDGAESIHRVIRLLKENGRWIVTEANERNEEIYMDGNLSGLMLEEIVTLAEEQMSQSCPEYDEYEIGTTSKGLSITVFQENEGGEIITAKRLSFRIKGTETGYRLEEVTADPD